jgi:hypothetical protein
MPWAGQMHRSCQRKYTASGVGEESNVPDLRYARFHRLFVFLKVLFPFSSTFYVWLRLILKLALILDHTVADCEGKCPDLHSGKENLAQDFKNCKIFISGIVSPRQIKAA